MDDKMMKAPEADGEYLRTMTREDHGPIFLSDFLPDVPAIMLIRLTHTAAKTY